MPQQSTVPVLKHLTVSQLADRLGVTKDYLRRSILGQPDGIPGLKIGRGHRAQWRIRLSDVERWEEGRIACYDATPNRPRRMR